jgi:hypothetical protein
VTTDELVRKLVAEQHGSPESEYSKLLDGPSFIALIDKAERDYPSASRG